MMIRTMLAVVSLVVPAAAQTPSQAAPQGVNAEPLAILHTTVGDMKCTLFPDKTPKTVDSFIGLAQGTKDWKDPATGKTVHGKPLYDGVIFHRVIPEFMIQTGDPSGSGSGDVGFEFENEPRADLLYDRPGRMGMANHGRDTNSSQFFITEVPFPSLNGGYTIFGQCDDAAVELVKKIARMPCTQGPVCTDYNSRLQTPVRINHIEIVGAVKPVAAHGSPPKPAAQPKASRKSPQ